MEQYYYEKMSKDKQLVYRQMMQGFLQLSDEISLPNVGGKDLQEVFFYMRLDHPEIFWVIDFTYKYYKDSPNLIFLPNYLFDKSKVKEHQSAMSARVKKLANPAMKMTEVDKEKYVHDFICENIKYDKLKKPYSHEIIGPLGHGVGVCEGIAKSVKILLDQLGVWNIIALCDNNPEKGIKYRHVWNVVKINGKYYHLDVTFDNTLGKQRLETAGVRYDYFNLCDKAVFRDHEPVLTRIPKCEDADSFYYKDKKLSFTKIEDVQKRSMQAAKKGKILTFHWRGGYFTKEIFGEFIKIFKEVGDSYQKVACVHVNWPQAVIQVEFTNHAGNPQIIMDEANEGEEKESEELVNGN